MVPSVSRGIFVRFFCLFFNGVGGCFYDGGCDYDGGSGYDGVGGCIFFLYFIRLQRFSSMLQ